jgi:protein-S-isoprenylcysteine O-methyltransferase Ste14
MASRIALLKLLPLVSVVAIFAARLVELRTPRDIVPGVVQERTSFYLFFLTGTLMFFGSIIEYLWRREQLGWITFLAGWLCAISSFALRRQAIAALGKFWSLHVEIRDRHELIRTGPFRWVRHPTYLSMILELLAAGLILKAFFTLVAVSVLFIPALLLRLRIEETALVDKFGDAYREYRRRTPALFPLNWPRSCR